MAAIPPTLLTILGGVILLGCAAQSIGTAGQAAQSEASILVASTPAAGSTVHGPVDVLNLHFSPAARLEETTISGPDGLMPMMVHSVGEVREYSIPLPDLEGGTYVVTWRASARNRLYHDSFGFSVK